MPRYRVTVGDEVIHSEHDEVVDAIGVAIRVAGHGARPSFVPEGCRWTTQEAIDAAVDGFLCLEGEDEVTTVEPVEEGS